MFFSSALKSALIGGGIGGLAGLGACMWLIPEEWTFFAGDTILAGSVVCGLLGLIYGESFTNWLADHWDWFT